METNGSAGVAEVLKDDQDVVDIVEPTEAGHGFEEVVDVTVFLVDMDRDFAAYNAVYREYFEPIQATRTTLAILALPTPIAVEFKVIAKPGERGPQ